MTKLLDEIADLQARCDRRQEMIRKLRVELADSWLRGWGWGICTGVLAGVILMTALVSCWR